MPVGLRVRQRCAAPTVDGSGLGAAAEQVLDDVEMALGGSQVQRGATVVIGGRGVDAGGDQGADLVEIALAGGPGECDDVLDLGLVLLAARVTLGGAALSDGEGVEDMHVVFGDEPAAELDAAHRVAVLVQPR